VKKVDLETHLNESSLFEAGEATFPTLSIYPTNNLTKNNLE
jgi:hypothetical protein